MPVTMGMHVVVVYYMRGSLVLLVDLDIANN